MKIGFIGTHCSAKTTTVSYVLQYLKRRSIHDVMIRHEVPRRCPYPINQGASFKTQFWITSEVIRSELELEMKCWHLLCDRTVIDQVVYAYDAHMDGTISEKEFQMILALSKLWLRIRPYDVVYLLDPFKLVADSVRPADLTWQLKIEKLFKSWTKELLNESEVITKTELVIMSEPNKDDRLKSVANDVLLRIKGGKKNG